MRNKYTLVTHAVGYHNDVFGKGVNSLENKVCFSFNQKEACTDIGRGGCCIGKFVFAILDWRGTKHARKIDRVIGVCDDNKKGIIIKLKYK